jgi:hypothetical protein
VIVLPLPVAWSLALDTFTAVLPPLLKFIQFILPTINN